MYSKKTSTPKAGYTSHTVHERPSSLVEKDSSSAVDYYHYICRMELHLSLSHLSCRGVELSKEEATPLVTICKNLKKNPTL